MPLSRAVGSGVRAYVSVKWLYLVWVFVLCTVNLILNRIPKRNARPGVRGRRVARFSARCRSDHGDILEHTNSITVSQI